MDESRLAAFTDALLAIVMTILVLELNTPDDVSASGFWEMRAELFSYALSFFWLGAMWVNLHREWQHIEQVDNIVVWWSIVMLFFASLFPFATKVADGQFTSTTAQVFYGIVVLAVTFSNSALYRALAKANPSREYEHRMANRSRWARVDIAIKVLGMVIALTVWPPAMMFAVLITLVGIVIPMQLSSPRE